MRIVLGILLIAVGAFGAYMILTGRFPSSANIVPVSSGGEKQTLPTGPGGTSGGNLTTGSGGQSWQSILTNFGHAMPSVHQGDRLASMGGMY